MPHSLAEFPNHCSVSSHRRRRISSRPRSFEPLEERLLLSADAVLEWNAVALEAVAADHSAAHPEQGGPTRTGRALAIVHAAMFDAANGIDQTYTPYLVTKQAPKKTNMDAAVAAAAHRTLVHLYPARAETFDAALEATLNDLSGVGGKRKGVEWGRLVAKRILVAREHDGSDTDPIYVEGTLPGEHRQDPEHPDQGFLSSGWGSVKPFAITSALDFRAPPPPELTSTEYADAFNEVKVLGAADAEIRDRNEDGLPDRTAEQTRIGIFWGYDGTPRMGTPPRLYNQIARVLAMQQGNTELETARLFALVNIAMADAGIASWETKYVYNFWRPILAIREADPGTGASGLGDGNPATAGETTWTPLGAPCSNECPAGSNFTPPFPAYTSGHATIGAALFRMLRNFYDTDNIAFDVTSEECNGVTTDQNGDVRDPMTRSFTSFSGAAEENGQSRIFLGIHWRFDKTAGISQGNAIADFVFQNYLRPE